MTPKDITTTERSPRVCPVESAGALDSRLRRLFQDPGKILSPYIKGDMIVLELGCGPGYFTIELAKLLGDRGKVVAADLQQGMLDIVDRKIRGTELEKKVELHKCSSDSIGLKFKTDFIFAFYVIHEIPDKRQLFSELHSYLNPGGMIYIAEPRFHVSAEHFNQMENIMQEKGFNITRKAGTLLNRTITGVI